MDERITFHEFTGSAAETLAHLVSLQQDLVFASEAAELAQQALAENPENSLISHLYSSAVIAYSRAFVSGRRNGLTETYVESIGPGALEAHRYIRRIRDQHIAHQVSPFETVKIGIAVDTADPDHPDYGVAHLGIRRLTDDVNGVGNIIRLCAALIQRLEPEIVEARQSVLREAADLSVDQIASLPVLAVEAPAPVIDSSPPRS